MYLLKEFEESPAKIWESNIFGKSLHVKHTVVEILPSVTDFFTKPRSQPSVVSQANSTGSQPNAASQTNGAGSTASSSQQSANPQANAPSQQVNG